MTHRSDLEAVGTGHPRTPQTPAPGRGFEERLSEREVWADRFGIRHRIDEMAEEYLWSVLGYLRWYAPEIRALTLDVEDSQIGLTPWLEMQPIWGAIACELVRRGIIACPAQAMEHLVASGPVPWEADEADLQPDGARFDG